MDKNTKKILTTTAVAAATVAGVTATANNVKADTVDQAATQSTNDQLKQAEQNVDAQKQNVQSATSAGRALGPLIGALVIDNFSYLTLFVVCTVLVLISVLLFSIINAYNKKKIAE